MKSLWPGSGEAGLFAARAGQAYRDGVVEELEKMQMPTLDCSRRVFSVAEVEIFCTATVMLGRLSVAISDVAISDVDWAMAMRGATKAASAR